MNESIRILVVEDDDKHLENVQALLAAETPKYPFAIEVVYARDFASAMAILDEGGVDGVLSDVFYPGNAGGAADVPSGQRLAEYCLERGLPVVLCTSTYHHCRATQPVHEWAMSRGFWLFDNAPLDYRDNEVTAAEKPWKVAFTGLMIFIIGMRYRIGGIGIQDGKVTGNYESPAYDILRAAPPLQVTAQQFVSEFGFPRDPELDKLPPLPTGPKRI